MGGAIPGPLIVRCTRATSAALSAERVETMISASPVADAGGLELHPNAMTTNATRTKRRRRSRSSAMRPYFEGLPVGVYRGVPRERALRSLPRGGADGARRPNRAAEDDRLQIRAVECHSKQLE